jgi:plasmid stability protein
MAILQVREVDDRLYSLLKAKAKKENRSLSQEVISILENYLANPVTFNKNPTRDFLSLAEAWSDDRPAKAITGQIRRSRKNSKRFEAENVLFD